MTLIIVVLFRDSKGNQEILFASEGRALRNDTKEIWSEDCIKTRPISPRLCIGYTGKNSEFFEIALKKLNNDLSRIKKLDISFAVSKLKTIIFSLIKDDPSLTLGKGKVPTIHKFILGGLDQNKIKLVRLSSKNDFLPTINPFSPKDMLSYNISGSDDAIQDYVNQYLEKHLSESISSDQIADILVDAIREAAKISSAINDRVHIRRLSKGFVLEYMDKAGV